MRKAYDTFLQAEVSADLAAKAGSSEPYRYECAHCGEGVRLAAVGSTNRGAYFKHRNGNNDVECKNYLGQYGTYSTDARSRKSKNERAEFYFDSNTKLFYLGLCFSKDEITAYEQRATTFELRAAPQAKPFYSLLINNRNFRPDIQEMIPLAEFSYDYFLSKTINGEKRKYTFFNRCKNSPTFFKIQVKDNSYRAKLVRSSVLYTNMPYFAVYQTHQWSPMDSSLPSEIQVENAFKFTTMGKNFLGKEYTITSKTAQVDSLLTSWGYQLETAETLTLLWPPSASSDESVLINANYAYLYSTFELQAHGNINLYPNDIKRISDGISKVSINSRTKVYKKNTELVLDKSKPSSKHYDVISVTREIKKNPVVSDDDNSYLFNRSGISPLSKGMTISLTPGSNIRHYSFGYLDGCIIPQGYSALTSARLLQDILLHYKRMENFKWDDFDMLELSQTAFRYIESCEESGQINSAVKRFIIEGQI